MKHCQRVLAVALFVGAGASVQAQTIVNGNFATDLSGWTTQGSNTMWVSDLGPDNLPGVAWLNDVPGPVAFIQQTITGLTAGQDYTLSGFYKTRDLFVAPGSFTVTIDGTTDFTEPQTSAVTTWTPFSFTFAPAASSAVLSLNAQVGSDSDYVVDNIAIQSNVTSTPEPGSVALFVGMGLSGAGVLARRRKRAVKAH